MKGSYGGFIFNSDFDNGNLFKVIEVDEYVPLVNNLSCLQKNEFQEILSSLKGYKKKHTQILNSDSKEGGSDIVYIKRYCVWTKPDAYDSGKNIKNRTWFYFSVTEQRGYDETQDATNNLNKKIKKDSSSNSLSKSDIYSNENSLSSSIQNKSNEKLENKDSENKNNNSNKKMEECENSNKQNLNSTNDKDNNEGK